ncbi:hypothetical protein LX64_01818 [Chitinophaga skermanii]|uniref:Uncharacterized protein n=1 Tax=Chitinophaga skermanii TaxID=331697 RepID=A0A327QR21_9BACT|nr:hypothetical protein [Chitinophaga skermanii]RAJ06691.1 hypothetical protein LX64_01818 [Chitinophaga skermanii]
MKKFPLALAAIIIALGSSLAVKAYASFNQSKAAAVGLYYWFTNGGTPFTVGLGTNHLSTAQATSLSCTKTVKPVTCATARATDSPTGTIVKRIYIK